MKKGFRGRMGVGNLPPSEREKLFHFVEKDYTLKGEGCTLKRGVNRLKWNTLEKRLDICLII